MPVGAGRRRQKSAAAVQAAAACQEAALDATADCSADGPSGQGFPVGFPASFPAANAFAHLPLLSHNGYGWPMQVCPAACMRLRAWPPFDCSVCAGDTLAVLPQALQAGA